MQIKAASADEYLVRIPEERRAAMNTLRNTILANLPEGFEENLENGMISYVVPHSIYPDGYHCDPKTPLPFLALASQKNFIALYHMGLYADPSLLQWFTEAWPKHAKGRLDMGKSCIRFKKPEQIPFALIGELCASMTVHHWIAVYEDRLKNPQRIHQK